VKDSRERGFPSFERPVHLVVASDGFVGFGGPLWRCHLPRFAFDRHPAKGDVLRQIKVFGALRKSGIERGIAPFSRPTDLPSRDLLLKGGVASERASVFFVHRAAPL